MSQETHLVSQPAPPKETKKPGRHGKRFATKVEEAEEGYFDFEWRQSRGTGQPVWPQQNKARETVPGGSETFLSVRVLTRSMLEAWLPSITDDNVSRILLPRNMAATNVMVSQIIGK